MSRSYWITPQRIICLICLHFLACESPKRNLLNAENDSFIAGELDQSVEIDLMMSSDFRQPLDESVADALLEDAFMESSLLDERGEGIFREGCPRTGFSHARILSERGELKGEHAIADAGDLLLMNARAAFVIQDPSRASRTWWYYGGQVVDAIPIEGCDQADEDRLNSLGIVIGEGQVTALDQSTMRAFEGLSAELISDGRDGGEARVRVYGHDSPMWLVEFELMSRALKLGRPKLRSESLALNMWIDYILPPDESVLHIQVGASNELGEARTLRLATLAFFGDKAHEHLFAPDELNLGGVRLYTGLPWLSAGNLALTLNAAQMATAHFAGVDLFLDLTRFIAGDRFEASIGDNDEPYSVDRLDTKTWEMSLSVSSHGLSTAASAFSERYPTPSPGRRHDNSLSTLRVSLAPHEPEELISVINATDTGLTPNSLSLTQRQSRIELWALTSEGDEVGQLGEYWLSQSQLKGEEEIDLPLPGLLLEGEQYQLRLELLGAPSLRSEPFDYTPSEDLTELPAPLRVIQAPPRGVLDIELTNQEGQGIPGTLRLTPIHLSSGETPEGFTAILEPQVFHIIEQSQLALAPGRYQYLVSRGLEYDIKTGEIEVLPATINRLELSLSHLNPTPKRLSFDAHVHAGPSPDSDVLIIDRLRGAAAEGVEIVAGTDHEVITDWAESSTPSLQKWVQTLIAEEATATLPEHMNIYPLPPRSDQLRGDPPQWYGLGFDQVIELLKDRGAPIIQLNHPRQGCNYLCIIGYDRETGLSNPNLSTLHLGYDEGEIWAWGFNAVELLNKARPIFIDPDLPEETGFYEDWASFINLGQKVTAMGVTDIHSRDGMGLPVTLLEFPESDDDISPEGLSPSAVAEAVTSGRAQVSAGAWVDLTVNGAGLGELVRATHDPETTEASYVEISIDVKALPVVDVTWVYLFVNCDVLYSWPADSPHSVNKHHQEQRLSLDQDSWITVMAFGDEPMPKGLNQYDPRVTPRVITNPIYIDADGDGLWTAPGGKSCLIPEGRQP